MIIEVNSDTTIDRLKRKIKIECTPILDSVAEPDLLLYSATHQDVNEEDVSHVLANPNPYLQDLLEPFQTIAECFPVIPANRIHILIRLPGMSSSVDVNLRVSGVLVIS